MSFQLMELKLLTQKSQSVAQAKKDFPAGSPELAEELSNIEKIHAKGLRQARKEAKRAAPSREPGPKQAKVDGLKLKQKMYSKVFVVGDGYEHARNVLYDFFEPDEWYTSKSGCRGSNTHLSYHGGVKGCFKITTEELGGGGEATIWQADDNEDDLPEAAEFDESGHTADFEEEEARMNALLNARECT